jgi:hypothetical protein
MKQCSFIERFHGISMPVCCNILTKVSPLRIQQGHPIFAIAVQTVQTSHRNSLRPLYSVGRCWFLPVPSRKIEFLSCEILRLSNWVVIPKRPFGDDHCRETGFGQSSALLGAINGQKGHRLQRLPSLFFTSDEEPD